MIKQHRDARSSRCAHPTAAAMPTSATSTLPIAFLLHSLAGRAAHEAHAHVAAGRAFVVVQQRLPDLPTLLRRLLQQAPWAGRDPVLLRGRHRTPAIRQDCVWGVSDFCAGVEVMAQHSTARYCPTSRCSRPG